MLNLSKSEKYVILFLFGCALLGTGITYTRNYFLRSSVKIIEQPELFQRKEALNSPATKVNINTDSINELCSLPEIGPSLARRIIEHRRQFGLYRRVEDIKNVKGIGEAKYNILKELISVE